MISIKPQNVGKLHKALGVAQGSPIPAPKLDKALSSKSPSLKKEATFAKNAKSFKHAAGDKLPSVKPQKASMAPISTDRGTFKI